MLNAYLTSIANKLDANGHHRYADAVDNLRTAQALTMPESLGASYDKASSAALEVQKLAAQQASMLKATEADLKDLKDMRNNITKGARDFWRFRRSRYQSVNQVPQQPRTDLNAFGLRGAPAPQMRNSQNAQEQRVNPSETAPIAPLTDEVEAFFKWLETEQAQKLQQQNNGAGMNLPFQIG